MNNKQPIITALAGLTVAALKHSPADDPAPLLGWYLIISDAICALPDAGPLASGDSSGAVGGAIAEFAVGTLVADETQPLILAALQKHTNLLSEIASGIAVQGARTDLAEQLSVVRTPLASTLSKSILEDEMKRRGVLADNTLDADKFSEAERSDDAAKEALATFDTLAAIVTAAAEKRFAADPFAPTFELFAGEDAVTVRLYPRPGSVQYIVNVTGPRSSAVRMEGALPSPILVSQVVESPL